MININMKIEELMVDDWVKLHYDVNYKTGEPLYTHVQITGINKDGTIDVNCIVDKSKSMQDGWDLKLIEPIPVTLEILEKNGFEVNSNNSRMFFHHDNYRLCYYFNSSNRFSSFNMIDGSLVQKVIVNVHELQHALKLCGINKEIKL